MLNPKIEKALNDQINHEMHSAYNYLAMAAYCEHVNLAGFSQWMLHQRQEELAHAMRLYKYLLDRGGMLDLASVKKPRTDYKTIAELFESALESEKANTAAINNLYSLAIDLKDYATQSALQWFIDEQVEEEKLMSDVLALVKLGGDDKSALLVLNRQLGERRGEGAGATP